MQKCKSCEFWKNEEKKKTKCELAAGGFFHEDLIFCQILKNRKNLSHKQSFSLRYFVFSKARVNIYISRLIHG